MRNENKPEITHSNAEQIAVRNLTQNRKNRSSEQNAKNTFDFLSIEKMLTEFQQVLWNVKTIELTQTLRKINEWKTKIQNRIIKRKKALKANNV